MIKAPENLRRGDGRRQPAAAATASLPERVAGGKHVDGL